MKETDKLHYEIGGLREENRLLKYTLTSMKKQRDVTVSLCPSHS